MPVGEACTRCEVRFCPCSSERAPSAGPAPFVGKAVHPHWVVAVPLMKISGPRSCGCVSGLSGRCHWSRCPSVHRTLRILLAQAAPKSWVWVVVFVPRFLGCGGDRIILHLHMACGESSPMSVKKLAGVLTGILLKPRISWGCCPFSYVRPSDPLAWCLPGIYIFPGCS